MAHRAARGGQALLAAACLGVGLGLGFEFGLGLRLTLALALTRPSSLLPLLGMSSYKLLAAPKLTGRTGGL